MSPPDLDPARAAGNRQSLPGHRATRLRRGGDAGVATVTLNRPARRNPLAFGSDAELRDLFVALTQATGVRPAVVTGAGGNLCRGGEEGERRGVFNRRVDPDALQAETQAICMLTQDLRRAREGFVARQRRGSGAISLAGGEAQRAAWLPRVARGRSSTPRSSAWGGLHVASGQVVGSLHREIRALRIDEGATEVQQPIIARELLRTAGAGAGTAGGARA